MKLALLASLALVALASAAVHKPEPLCCGWQQKESLALADEPVSFVLSLKEDAGAIDTIKKLALAVNDPTSPQYGEFLSRKQLAAATQPSVDSIQAVTSWLGASGVSYRISGSRVEVFTTTTHAETLLATRFLALTHSSHPGQTIRRASTYSLPDSVEDAIQAVFGLHGLPLPKTAPLLRDTTGMPAEPANVTPSVLIQTYSIEGVSPKGLASNHQAVAEFQGQYMNSTDLAVFFKDYVAKYKLSSDDTVAKFVGDQDKQEGQTEASLDIQYMMGINPGIKSEFWLYNSMDFCGDLANWTAAILADESAPLVHSVSYGWQGNLKQLQCEDSKVQVVDDNYAKLAAAGITIIFASGDSGSGYSPGSDPTACEGAGTTGTILEGTILHTLPVMEQMQCCEEGQNYAGWSYVPANKSDLVTPLEGACTGVETGKTFKGTLQVKILTTSTDECCDLASREALAGVKGYTFTPVEGDKEGRGECHLWTEITGSVTSDNSTSGHAPPTPPQAQCHVFSKITGNASHTGAVSGTPKPKAIQLYPSWPASSPWVTAVGSTRFVGQKAGNEEMATDQFGSGGGFSTMFNYSDHATWQASAIKAYLANAPQLPPAGSYPPSGRGTPDVSALGEGYQVMINGQVEAVGGTSASAPAFAGMVSLLNEARLQKGGKAMGFLNPWIYQNTDAFTDITKGSNLIGRGTFSLPYGYNCTKGWDPVSGVGTPVFSKMLTAALAN